jgi:release factor glutamine methyltransferase
VLIPRPETELLVETAIQWLQSHPESRRGVDAGTGSGCIPVSIACHIPDINFIAVDTSRAALNVARMNIHRHDLSGQVSLVQANLLSSLTSTYIPSADIAGLQGARFEPHQALDGGETGLDLILQLLEEARRILSPAGLMLLEIEYRQGKIAAKAAAKYFPGASIQVLDDLAGLPRVLQIENSP